jgi:hypothetical protein
MTLVLKWRCRATKAKSAADREISAKVREKAKSKRPGLGLPEARKHIRSLPNFNPSDYFVGEKALKTMSGEEVL